MTTTSINRAPVLTLWAAVVSERLGFDEAESLSLGKALAGLNAQSKGRRLGIFKPHEEKPSKARAKEHGQEFSVELCGRPVPARNTEDGIRAVSGTEPIDPDGVRRYWKANLAMISKPSERQCGGSRRVTHPKNWPVAASISTRTFVRRSRKAFAGGARSGHWTLR